MGQGFQARREGPDYVAEKLRDLQRQLDALRGAAPLRNSAIGGGAGLMSADFDGNLTTGDTGTAGWAIGDGDAVFNTLTLRDAIITDNALANPTNFAIGASNIGTAWSTSTSMANKVTTTIAVPVGWDRALIFAFGSVIFKDSAANRFDSRVTIDGNAGATLINLANLTGCTAVTHQRVETGTSGNTITLATQVLSAVATGGDPANQATIAGFAILLRS